MTVTRDLEATLERALADAKRRHHEYLTLEHLLFALLGDPIAARILTACGVDTALLELGLEEFFSGTSELEPKDSEDQAEHPKQTPAFWRVLQRAALHVQGAGREAIDGGNVLVALLRERDSQAVHLLEKQGVTRLDVLRFVSHGVAKAGGHADPHSRGAEEDEEAPPIKDPLFAFTTNLNERAKKGNIDPLIGRGDELARVTQVLCRRRKNNPVLVGNPGVGKTAIVEGLALAIHEKRVPKLLADATLYSLDMGAILAGTKFRGEFEERLKGVINAVQKDANAILFIDEIHTIVGAGATSGGSMDASNLLKPALANGDVRCIGSTTFPEYKSSFERDRALGRRFQKIEVYEPSVAETVLILKGLRARYEAHHEVTYSDDALASAADLAARYINDRHLPDKAIDVLDEAGAANRLRPAEEKLAEIGSKQVEAVVARLAKIPEKSVSSDDEDALKRLEPELKKVLFGQDPAIAAMTSAIKLSRAGLGPQERPIGSFLFSGPTGVGKTELAKQLARVLGVEFLRFDMTEYMEKHTVSRLIGAPPGYVGFDQGGLLTDAIRKTPHSVLLLDEIEKAHPDVFNVLLQVMDHATLTDNNGRKADFRHVILILTTNAGARELLAGQVGFGQAGKTASTIERSKGAIERAFSPEFRNRLDAWIVFEPLNAEAIGRVVNEQIGELEKQLADKKVRLELSPSGRAWLAEKGYEPQFGARPMARLIQDKIAKPLAEAVLFGALRKGGIVRVDGRENELVLEMDGEATPA